MFNKRLKSKKTKIAFLVRPVSQLSSIVSSACEGPNLNTPVPTRSRVRKRSDWIAREHSLEEEPQDLEKETSTEDKREQNYHIISISSPIAATFKANVLIQPLLIGLFCGPRGFTTCAPSGFPIFFSCALA